MSSSAVQSSNPSSTSPASAAPIAAPAAPASASPASSSLAPQHKATAARLASQKSTLEGQYGRVSLQITNATNALAQLNAQATQLATGITLLTDQLRAFAQEIGTDFESLIKLL